MDRQALFSGAETPVGHLVLDVEVLANYLQPQLDGFESPLTATKFKGGRCSPTYPVEWSQAAGSCGHDRRAGLWNKPMR
jgi:hypothetical protein